MWQMQTVGDRNRICVTDSDCMWQKQKVCDRHCLYVRETYLLWQTQTVSEMQQGSDAPDAVCAQFLQLGNLFLFCPLFWIQFRHILYFGCIFAHLIFFLFAYFWKFFQKFQAYFVQFSKLKFLSVYFLKLFATLECIREVPPKETTTDYMWQT